MVMNEAASAPVVVLKRSYTGTHHPQRRQRAHAPRLVWGHVRCVYSERAVTVP